VHRVSVPPTRSTGKCQDVAIVGGESDNLSLGAGVESLRGDSSDAVGAWRVLDAQRELERKTVVLVLEVDAQKLLDPF
jgi:hypothetical protein